MKINLRSFGIAKDIIGGSTTSLDIPMGSTIAQVKNELVDTYPKFKALAKFAIAVNEAYESDEYVIHEGDELVVIPPVSGG